MIITRFPDPAVLGTRMIMTRLHCRMPMDECGWWAGGGWRSPHPVSQDGFSNSDFQIFNWSFNKLWSYTYIKSKLSNLFPKADWRYGSWVWKSSFCLKIPSWVTKTIFKGEAGPNSQCIEGTLPPPTTCLYTEAPTSSLTHLGQSPPLILTTFVWKKVGRCTNCI